MPLCASDSGIDERTLTLVRGRECIDASRIVNLHDGVLPAGFPYDEFVLGSYWLPEGQVSTPVDADASAYTGLRVGRDSQRGTLDGRRSLLLQLHCRDGGMVVGSDALPFTARKYPMAPNEGPEWNHMNVQYTITWTIPLSLRARVDPRVLRHLESRHPGRFRRGAAAIRPWADAAGDPELVVEALARVPTAERIGPGAHTQLNFLVYLLDSGRGKFYSYVVNMYAQPKEATNQVSNDGEFAFVSTQLPRDGEPVAANRYFRASPLSRGSSPEPWREARFFRFHIGRRELKNAIDDLNASNVLGARGFSTDPANYVLTSAGLIQEQTYHRGESVLMGSSFGDFAVSIARKRGD